MTASLDAELDPIVVVLWFASQLPVHEMLRRPLESAQGLSIRYMERLAETGVETSVGSVGDSYDSALAGSVNALYTAEVTRARGPWTGLNAVELATLEWVDWFNNRRACSSRAATCRPPSTRRHAISVSRKR